jgi:DNA-binding GntR family transcriptional regulator
MEDDTLPQVASQRVADIVAQRILSGELKPGERIKQDNLAVELNVSRIPVRDALRMLESRGLVTLKANSGARVVSHTLKDMDMFYQVRQMLEPLLLEHSLPNLSDEDVVEIGEVRSQLDAIVDVDEYMSLNSYFFYLILRRHNVPVLKQINDRLWDSMHIHRRTFAAIALADPERRMMMIAERALLFDAVRHRQVDLARRLLGAHIGRLHEALRDYVKVTGSLPIGGDGKPFPY